MGILFGKKRKRGEDDQGTKNEHKITDKDKAVLDLKRQKIKMKNYKSRINAMLNKEVKMAKQLIKQKKKKKALLVLKKKKYLETLVVRTDKALLNVEKLVDSIEYASMQKQIFDAMKAGNECLQQINSEISVEEVEKLMEDTEEAIAYQDQVSNVLAGSLSNEDVSDVNEELAQLEKEDAELRALELGDQLPEVPVTTKKDVQQQQQPDDDQKVPAVVPAASKNSASNKKQVVLQ